MADQNPAQNKRQIVEMCAEAVHDKWVEAKVAQRVTSRPAEDGTEQIAPYATLPEHIKDLDRGSVEAVVDVLVSRGVPNVDARGSGENDFNSAAKGFQDERNHAIRERDESREELRILRADLAALSHNLRHGHISPREAADVLERHCHA